MTDIEITAERTLTKERDRTAVNVSRAIDQLRAALAQFERDLAEPDTVRFPSAAPENAARLMTEIAAGLAAVGSLNTALATISALA